MTTAGNGEGNGTRGPEIVTEGTGWHEQVGDRAELDVGFAATARHRADAVRGLGVRVAAAAPALEHPGLMVRHRRLRVHNEWRGTRVVGCRAGEDLTLLVTDVEVLEEVLAALVAAEPESLAGPRWSLADPAAARREAQHRAVEDARARAEGYAEALLGTLGPLRRLTESPEQGPVTYRMAAMESHSAAPDVRDLDIEPEPVRTTARCTTSWGFVTERRS